MRNTSKYTEIHLEKYGFEMFKIALHIAGVRTVEFKLIWKVSEAQKQYTHTTVLGTLYSRFHMET